jgi:ATP-dependent DNA helicase RecQ
MRIRGYTFNTLDRERDKRKTAHMAVAELSLKTALHEYFGFMKFKGDQEKIVKSLMSGRDVFVIMPTGGGKTLRYQLPAMMMDGVAIIISPLIALMKNQVDLVRN